jgi:hypothetical protein
MKIRNQNQRVESETDITENKQLILKYIHEELRRFYKMNKKLEGYLEGNNDRIKALRATLDLVKSS